jgi:chromosome segregation ATPase
MRRAPHGLLLAAVAMLLVPAAAGAADSDIEARLREQLRSAITQLRTLEDQNATLTAKQAEYEKQIQALKPQVATLTQQVADLQAEGEKAAAKAAELDSTITRLKGTLAARDATITGLNETVEKWKTEQAKAAALARLKEAERARLDGALKTMTNRAVTCEVKNDELFRLGNEILDRYGAVDVSDAMGAREPFIGFKRVELQNIVQDYQDMLMNQKVGP